MTVRNAIGWVARAAMAMAELHSAGRPHGRLSADAISISSEDCRSDGTLLPPSELSDKSIYHSLDRIDGEGPSMADDVWALGVTLYFALTKQYPYPEGVEGNIRNNRLRPPTAVAVHRAELDVMQRVMDRTTIPGHPLRATSIEALMAELTELSPTVPDLRPLAFDVQAAAQTVAEQPKRPSRASRAPADMREQLRRYGPWAGIVLFLLVVVAWRLATAPPQPQPKPMVSAAPATKTKPVAKTKASATTSATASASPSPPPTAGPPAPSELPSEDLLACASHLFPKDAFLRGKIRVDFPCRERNARKGQRAMTELLVRGGGGQVTNATREWVHLGWYQLALLAVARASCCQDPPPMTTGTIYIGCKLDEAIDALTKVAMSNQESGVLAALESFYRAARCAHGSGGDKAFGFETSPNGQQVAMFLRILSRARERKKQTAN